MTIGIPYSTASRPIKLKSGGSTSAGKYSALIPRREYLVNDDILLSPIILALEETEEGYWLASHPVIMAHGIGDTEEDTIQDFLDALTDLFIELTNSEEYLAPHLKNELMYLRTIISGDALQR